MPDACPGHAPVLLSGAERRHLVVLTWSVLAAIGGGQCRGRHADKIIDGRGRRVSRGAADRNGDRSLAERDTGEGDCLIDARFERLRVHGSADAEDKEAISIPA